MSGFVVWLTGLSGAGKSTLASLLTQEISRLGLHVECLDGDEVRKNLSHGLGFSREDRDHNVRRIGYVARMAARSGACAITAAISPYRAIRDEIRRNTEQFFEVYCECPIEVLAERDPKGLYKRALAGELKNFTGVDDPYEVPLSPEVVVRTDRDTAEECVQHILEGLRARGYLATALAAKASLPPPFGGEVFEARDASPEEMAAPSQELLVSMPIADNFLAVANGYFSPVCGFMTEREAVKVRKGGALEGGTPYWTEPFILPLSGDFEVQPGEVVRLVTPAGPLGLVRTSGDWREGTTRYLAGALEAVDPGATRSLCASGIRRMARDHGYRHVACVFVREAPSDEHSHILSAIHEVTDAVVVATTREHHAAWMVVWAELGLRGVLVTIPLDFPEEDARARLVFQKSVGAAVGLVLGTQ